jgi:hypothetical protein
LKDSLYGVLDKFLENLPDFGGVEAPLLHPFSYATMLARKFFARTIAALKPSVALAKMGFFPANGNPVLSDFVGQPRVRNHLLKYASGESHEN